MVRFTLCLALLTGLAAPATAQSGRIHGMIVDQTGAVLPAVQLRASMKDASGETTRSVVTDAKGTYELGTLAPGDWTVSMSLPGFESATRRLTVQTGDSLEWSATMQLGTLQETVTIVSGASDGPVRTEIAAPPAAAAPAVAAPPRAPAPGAIRVGGSIKAPRKIVDVRPVYPADAAAQGISGVVILQAVIGQDGFIREIAPLRSPNESLLLAATAAVNGWQFTPTLLNGSPVPVRMTVTLNFQQSF